ncbi:activator of (R)-2-hydroxyglutaryl-CoA dehydratase HgdC [Gottschalkia purinilytica]|uniref:Activator of (R)-2-hydroxyglutaryl-CoA dehydratase HgdC n=1 Tax=Gottschalkia purinilytica TaxID=1503 RepID=A0A0L0WDJ2_GOTPU|nr:acyl-CoA dehydratase activase [Gottschalkia purinilytica]KNF09543.1 activator of (R)-2-hydroxyglutaryl-CoA dehydratase HgdC [Gottschalkia purinilytica]
MKTCYLGVDVGSVSTNLVLIDENNDVIYKKYLRTQGKPIEVLKKGLNELSKEMKDIEIKGAGTTGSGRHLASIVLGADEVKNEITAHAIASINSVPNAKTIVEIGGQDSKIIIVRDGIVVDFAMNTVCAAGTGSFLDRQADRLGIHISEFGGLALNSKNPVRIAGRCAVFAESDMIHKQQLGHSQEDIAKGLCDALVRNYLSNVGKGKEILGDIVFQGGVAANIGIKRAFEEALNMDVIVPDNYDVMGAIGVAILASDKTKKTGVTKFKGMNIANVDHKVRGFECQDCANICEVIEIMAEDDIISRYGDKCGKWTNSLEITDRTMI